ncbi:dipicolinate synthase subunit DpsA [Oscillospiraceae bacterium PP1C4]
MIPYKTYAVIGGDLRQAHIANKLAAGGKTVYALLLEANKAVKPELVCTEPPEKILPRCDVIIFPLPLTTDEYYVNAPYSTQKVSVADCISAIKPHTSVFAGKVSASLRQYAVEAGVSIIDYLEREELAVKNAVITAEGAISIAIEELPIALFGSKCLITGHGRISRCLMRILTAMGAQVTVAARKYGDLAEIEAEGCKAIHIAALSEEMDRVDLIFNTVPAQILGWNQLSRLKKDALIIDLASKPGGVDMKFR